MTHDYRQRCREIAQSAHKEWVKKYDDGNGLLAVPVDELPDYPAPQHGDTWGKWRYNAHNLTLEYGNGFNPYYLDLEECKNSAGLLDWIFQVCNKSWMTTDERGHLLEAIDDLLHPQANLCSFGVDRKFDVTAYLRGKEAA